MHKLIFKMGDADEEIVKEICGGILSFHGYLARKGVISTPGWAELRSEILRLEPTLVEKAERYAQVRHDVAMSEAEKERIREELFDGDHFWPTL